MTHLENTDPFAEYLECLDNCCDAVQATAEHTKECAEQVGKAAQYSLLAVYHVKEILNDKR